jgi:hypothetical protein
VKGARWRIVVEVKSVRNFPQVQHSNSIYSPEGGLSQRPSYGLRYTKALFSCEFLLGNHGKATAEGRPLDRGDMSSIVYAVWRCSCNRRWDVDLKGPVRQPISENKEVCDKAGGEVVIGRGRAQTAKRGWQHWLRRSAGLRKGALAWRRPVSEVQ